MVVTGLLCGARVGVAAGALAGFAHGAWRVHEQRFLELGLRHLASRTAAASALEGAALGALLGVVLAGVVLLLAHAVRSSSRTQARDPIGAGVLVVGLQGVAGAALVALRSVPSWPSLHSPSGILATAGVSLLGVALAWRLGRLHPAVHRAARRMAALFGARAALVPSLAAVGALAVASAVTARAADPSRPNLVLVTVDTLRADHLGAYGYVRDTSPEIDGLARDGVRFDRAVVQWPKTTPSLASLHTGVYPSTSGVTRHTQQAVPARYATLAERLAEAGYATAAVVTNGNLASAYGFDQGFGSYVETWRAETADDPERGAHVTDAALGWLEARSDDRPFFLWVHYVDPHAFYEPPAPFDGMFVGDAHYDPSLRAPLKPRAAEDIGGIPSRALLGNQDEVAYYVAQYDAEIRYADQEIGRLLRRLRSDDLGPRTAIVFSADHGESLGEHDYYFEHGRLPYDDCVRVPLIVRLPGGTGGGRIIAAPVQVLDLLPTLLGLAGVPVPAEAEGRSLQPLLADGSDPGRSPQAFTESGYTDAWQRAVRDERWKLVWMPDPEDRALVDGAEWSLYDLAADAGETKNVASEHPTEVGRLRSVLETWMRRPQAAPVTAARAPKIDRDTEERLRKLGYVR